jgi:hypothetical protein
MATTQGSFEQTLGTYRAWMSIHKATGSIPAKTAADNAKAWILNYLQSVEKSISANTAYINKLTTDYSKTNPEIVAAQRTIEKAKTEGPKLENTYMTDKEAAETPARDFTDYYIKGGVLLGIGALVAVLSL